MLENKLADTTMLDRAATENAEPSVRRPFLFRSPDADRNRHRESYGMCLALYLSLHLTTKASSSPRTKVPFALLVTAGMGSWWSQEVRITVSSY